MCGLSPWCTDMGAATKYWEGGTIGEKTIAGIAMVAYVANLGNLFNWTKTVKVGQYTLRVEHHATEAAKKGLHLRLYGPVSGEIRNITSLEQALKQLPNALKNNPAVRDAINKGLEQLRKVR